MERLNRGDKIYLDENQKKESLVNEYLTCRDGVVSLYEYRNSSGYGSKTRLFYCIDTKHESESIILQTWNIILKEWIEESIIFDSDSFKFLKAIINGKEDESGGKYSVIRDYNDDIK